MVRAIIFDCFGVLTFDGWLSFKQKYFGDKPEQRDEVNDMGRRVNTGHLSYDSFIDRLAGLAGIKAEEAARAMHDNVPNDELFSYIRHILKPKYKIGLLSNAGRDMLEEIFTPEQLQLFDVAALSYQTGFLKPDDESYRNVAARLGVELDECVFVDDQERYCVAAGDLGMKVVWYRNFEQTKADLERILGS